MIEWSNKYNPFNSMKALANVDKWRSIVDGIVPPPLFVTVDTSNLCNFNCYFCNAKKVTDSATEDDMMSLEYLLELADVLREWGVKAICVAGGESLTNKYTEDFIRACYRNSIEVGVVTNGSLMDRFPSLQLCKWVGVSVNSGNADTFVSQKMSTEKMFYKVLSNIEELAKTDTTEVTYKMVISSDNYYTIYEAISKAKSTGCNQIHLRPVGAPWYNLDMKFDFTKYMISSVEDQISKGREDFEDENFKVYGITHKFSPEWNIEHSFKKCWAAYTTCYFGPKGYVGLCCDRRGDPRTKLATLNSPRDVYKYWGSEEHKRIVENIDIGSCPRCTYKHVQEIFENVIINDKMFPNFF